MPYERSSLPRWDGTKPAAEAAADVLEAVNGWTSSPALSDLVLAFGGRIPSGAPLGTRLAYLDSFSAEHWDFRRGRERNLAMAAEFPPALEEQIRDSAEGLGLVTPEPPQRDSYDVALVLGGLVRACYVRPRYAAWLIQHDTALQKVVALGGFRPLGGDEHDLAAALGIDSANEFGAMVAGVQRAFGFTDSPTIEQSSQGEPSNADWAVATFNGPPSVEVLAAPSAAPGDRRANTADTYEWWSHRFDARGRSILIITSTIYVPYQGADAIRLLAIPNGAFVDTVGVPPANSDLGRWTQTFTAANYLQEVRSSIRGFRALVGALGM